MIFNLLLSDPDNIADGYGGIDIQPILTLLITIIAITVTVITACIICYLYNNCNNEEIKNKKWIKPTLIISAILIIILLVILCCFACAK